MRLKSELRRGEVSETQFSLLEQRVGGIEAAVHDLASKIDVWMSTRSQSSWRIVGFIAAILIPLAFIVNLYITSAISPWAAVSNQAKAIAESNSVINGRLVEDMGTVKAQNADSKRDREDQRTILTRTIEVQTSILQQFARADAERLANEREVETQVDAMSQMYNEKIAEIFRRLADSQNALHDMGAKVPVAPNGPFAFPNISNRNHRTPKQ